MPSFCWDDLESTVFLRSCRTGTAVVMGRLSFSSAIQLSVALKVPSFTTGDPVAVSGEATGASLTPWKARRNVRQVWLLYPVGRAPGPQTTKKLAVQQKCRPVSLL
jgi:hypothetical protein